MIFFEKNIFCAFIVQIFSIIQIDYFLLFFRKNGILMIGYTFFVLFRFANAWGIIKKDD